MAYNLVPGMESIPEGTGAIRQTMTSVKDADKHIDKGRFDVRMLMTDRRSVTYSYQSLALSVI